MLSFRTCGLFPADPWISQIKGQHHPGQRTSSSGSIGIIERTPGKSSSKPAHSLAAGGIAAGA
jgi:hypothetical protein